MAAVRERRTAGVNVLIGCPGYYGRVRPMTACDGWAVSHY